jgi:hypothetical protein
MLSRLPFPLSLVVLVAGLATTVWGFIEYNQPTLNLIGLSTGIPLLLGGLVMKAVELKPVPALFPVSAEVAAARQAYATEIQRQIVADITKYNYGADAHMDNALEFLKLKGRTDAELPRLQGYGEELRDGRYTLVLHFSTPAAVPFSQWQQSYEKKMATFFGRDVDVTLTPLPEGRVQLALTTNSAVGSPS